MILIEILQSLILPSIFIFLFFLVGLALLFFKKKKTGLAFLIIATSFYFLFSITPVADIILVPLEKQYSYPTEAKINSVGTIVVLSGGVKNKDLPLPSVFGDSMLFRLNEAFKIYSYSKNRRYIC